ncbi:MAG: transposase [Stellaceae bacterium]
MTTGSGRSFTTMRRVMTVPGVGPLTASDFTAAADPTRPRHSRDVGAYLELAPRLQSGEVDRDGHVFQM